VIDPHNPPHILTATDAELQEFLLFSIAVAGKHAASTAASLASWLADGEQGWQWLAGMPGWPKRAEDFTPFRKLRYYVYRYTIYTSKDSAPRYHVAEDVLGIDLKRHGFGCYNQRAKSFIQLVNECIDVRTVSYEQLIGIHGIGIKTANFFLAYSGLDEDRVILDTHILKWLCGNGWPDIPKVTPRGKKEYERIASYFREEASGLALTTLELDKEIWTAAARS
jgi:hypothetical protein